uniref:Prefoldin subunit alpha n=1 Tax=Fervidicoccus fontis TaxID=683846 RepID=A0A7J3ZJP5_9CREN
MTEEAEEAGVHEAGITALAQQLEVLEQHLARLRQTLDVVNSTLMNARRARVCLEELRKYDKGRDVLVAVDSGGVALVRAKPLDENPIVHVGLDVYVQVDFEHAERILSEKERLLLEQARRVQSELERIAKEYRRLQEALYSQYARMAAPRPRREAGKQPET